MAYEPRPNTGTLFINQKKTVDSHPDLRGEAFIDRELLKTLMGKSDALVKVAIAAWNKESAKGTAYLSLSISEPWEPQQQQSNKQPWEK
mgnify:CR=1 FL=1